MSELWECEAKEPTEVEILDAAKLAIKLPAEEQYASVEITFLDRSTDKKEAICYPVTRVLLRNLNLEPVVEYNVVDGMWVTDG